LSKYKLSVSGVYRIEGEGGSLLSLVVLGFQTELFLFEEKEAVYMKIE